MTPEKSAQEIVREIFASSDRHYAEKKCVALIEADRARRDEERQVEARVRQQMLKALKHAAEALEDDCRNVYIAKGAYTAIHLAIAAAEALGGTASPDAT